LLLAPLSSGHRWLVLPAILGGGAIALWLLRRDRAAAGNELASREERRRELLSMLARVLVVSLLLLALVTLLGMPPAFRMPRERPLVWLAVLSLYPFVGQRGSQWASGRVFG
jgi:uncharacterized membrane protein YbhN (UPF0104 family)